MIIQLKYVLSETERTIPIVCPDIAFQLTNDLIFPAQEMRSFLFFVIVAPGTGGVKR